MAYTTNDAPYNQTTKERIGAVVVILFILFCVGFIGYWLYPKTSQVTEVSLLAEQKKCEDWGGMFRVRIANRGFYYEWDEKYPIIQKIVCRKVYFTENKEIKETLFDYEVN